MHYLYEREFSLPVLENTIAHPPVDLSPEDLATLKQRAQELRVAQKRDESNQPAVNSRRLAANRANARKSTGPRTPEGKARVSQNACKRGLRAARLPGDNHAEFEHFVSSLQLKMRPPTIAHQALFLQIATQLWQIHRLPETRARLHKEELDQICPETRRLSSPRILAQCFSHAPNNAFLALQRYETAAHNNLARLLKLYHQLADLFPDAGNLEDPDQCSPFDSRLSPAYSSRNAGNPAPALDPAPQKPCRPGNPAAPDPSHSPAPAPSPALDSATVPITPITNQTQPPTPDSQAPSHTQPLSHQSFSHNSLSHNPLPQSPEKQTQFAPIQPPKCAEKPKTMAQIINPNNDWGVRTVRRTMAPRL